MGLCWDCDEEITFRFIGGVCTPIHESGRCGEYRKTAIPVKCRKCGQAVYFVQHNGGSVWFDELGPPWPKHPCSEPSQTSTATWTNTATLPDRGWTKCEMCKTRMQLDAYAEHLRMHHPTMKKAYPPFPPASAAVSHNPATNAITPFVVKTRVQKGRRLCGYCNTIFDTDLYAEHVRTAHHRRDPAGQSNRKKLGKRSARGSTVRSTPHEKRDGK
jgi:hypothetical protein